MVQQRADFRVGAAIVGKTELPVRIGLVYDGANAAVEMGDIDVINRHQYGDDRFISQCMYQIVRRQLLPETGFKEMFERKVLSVDKIGPSVKLRVKPGTGLPIAALLVTEIMAEGIDIFVQLVPCAVELRLKKW